MGIDGLEIAQVVVGDSQVNVGRATALSLPDISIEMSGINSMPDLRAIQPQGG
jgi:hypothetical protein